MNRKRLFFRIVIICMLMALAGCDVDRLAYFQDMFAKETSAPAEQMVLSSQPAQIQTVFPSPSPAPAQTYTLVPVDVEGVSSAELADYFCEIALNVEYGGTNGVLKRWEEPIRVMVSGDYTQKDMSVLTAHIDALNAMKELPEISIVDTDANFLVYFLPLEEMATTIPGYVEGNWGYFYLTWNGDYEIQQAVIGIANDVTTQKMRSHLILEEFTQSLGLMNDNKKYKDSIFQIEFTQTQALTDADWTLVRLLYNDAFRPAMTETQVKDILNAAIEQ